MKTVKLLLALSLLVALAACAPARADRLSAATAGNAEARAVPNQVAADLPAPRTVTATGDAEVRVVPDEVVLTLGVETWNKDLKVAQEENDRIVQKLLALAKSYGVEAKHIQTDYISVEPRYRDSYEQKEFIGYFVRKTVVITLKDIAKFEGLLGDALGSGVNYVHGVEFRTTELRKYRDQARAMAIKAAQEKATALAGALGQKVGEPLSINEDQSGWWSWYNSWWGSRWGGGMAQNVSQNAAPSGSISLDSDSTLAPGQISVNARVTVQFALQ